MGAECLLFLYGATHSAAAQNRKQVQTRAKAALSPLHIHGGDIERDSFQPQHHEQTLGEGTVADALTVAPRLGHTTERESVSETLLVTF